MHPLLIINSMRCCLKEMQCCTSLTTSDIRSCTSSVDYPFIHDVPSFELFPASFFDRASVSSYRRNLIKPLRMMWYGCLLVHGVRYTVVAKRLKIEGLIPRRPRAWPRAANVRRHRCQNRSRRLDVHLEARSVCHNLTQVKNLIGLCLRG
ncbi:hypothetical protein EVAR_13530_1 [Eumeta japonica]|uniref:Uncharacterized protein n=1 Tax=Eumeta variegata TaxID=151549 RepID=A0A4C1U9H4_EUMVA|nr:hypothetical protein EVAR_13530_1 [Eumeta japonica]